MPQILVTNDDGVYAPGLLALVHALNDIGEVTVLAPDKNWSASGHVKTLHRPLRVKEVILDDGTVAYASDGAPSDCVALALLGLWDCKYDLVVSGINSNANLGHDVTYSGTVTAAMEAVIWGIKGIAISVDAPDSSLRYDDYKFAAKVGKQVAERVLQNGLPKETLLNVNVPFLPEEKIKGFKVSRQGLRVYHDELVKRIDPRGKPYYWIGGDAPTGVPKEDTDIGVLHDGYISITPLKMDMTSYDAIPILKNWNWE